MSIQDTVSSHPTHFLAAVPVIEKARKDFNICSENWTYPTKHRIGTPKDDFYAEVWTDGMDWNLTLWLLYQKNFETYCIPFMHFERDVEIDKFNDYDLSNVIDCCLYHFGYFDKNPCLWRYSDEVWAYLAKLENSKNPAFVKCSYGHASQERVTFQLNKEVMARLEKTFSKNRIDATTDGNTLSRSDESK